MMVSIVPTTTASEALHGRAVPLAAICGAKPGFSYRPRFSDAKMSKMCARTASKPRQMAARAMRNMQVPAYWPVVIGVHGMEKSGVPVEVKKVMAIASMPIIVP